LQLRADQAAQRRSFESGGCASGQPHDQHRDLLADPSQRRAQLAVEVENRSGGLSLRHPIL
jgi:hypothetical protein